MPDNAVPSIGIMRYAVLRFALWMVFALSLFQSVTVTVAWWEQPDSLQGWEDWMWVGALPALLLIYLRYFSKLGCGAGCDLGAAEEKAESNARPGR